MFTSSRFLIIKTFSLKHKLQLLIRITKPTNLTETVFINKQSSHPPNIIADIPKTIHHAIHIMQKNISYKKNVFDRNIDIYQTALKIVALIEK